MRAILVTVVLLGSGSGVSPASEDRPLDFSRDIQPILSEHCYRCHGPDAEQRQAELRLDEPLAALAELPSGQRAIVPHQPQSSEVLTRVAHPDAALRMPPPEAGRALTEREVELLRRWIAQGAQWAEHWSFRPLWHGQVPEVAGRHWSGNAVDRFVLAELEAAGLTPSPPASPQVLLRRLSFDLAGLPPTPEEMRAFIADDRPDAYERQVDRLLHSAAYGERWARHWLDLARYSDTTADWLMDVGQAWLYRDWVVAALNSDLGYDLFAQRQLAADVLADEPAELAALGFLGLSPTYWKELRLAPEVIERIVADEWDERVDAVSRTFLGLTVSCARCHDHKFDPVTMQDYYALAGVFASTQLADRPLLPQGLAAQVEAAHRKADELTKQLEEARTARRAVHAARLQCELMDLRRTTPHYDAPWAHVVQDGSTYVEPDGDDRTQLVVRIGEARDLPIFQRGNPSSPGPLVQRRFLAALSDGPPTPWRQGSGRAELAIELFQQSRALTARVMVNRIWEQHFGRGLVRTVSDFGAQGERPSHPELLDYLAAELVRHDWSLKWLHREIVLSQTYRQSSVARSDALQVDPENRLLWRMNRRRLDVEMWRDAMLAVSGDLDRTVGGPAVALDDPAQRRRTLYGLIARRELDVMLRLYDFPEPTAHSPRRETTITPLQQLFVLNGPFVLHRAQALAERLRSAAGNDQQRVERAYQLLFGRPPDPLELKRGLEFLHDAAADATIASAWQDYAQALLGLNEFLFVD